MLYYSRNTFSSTRDGWIGETNYFIFKLIVKTIEKNEEKINVYSITTTQHFEPFVHRYHIS